MAGAFHCLFEDQCKNYVAGSGAGFNEPSSGCKHFNYYRSESCDSVFEKRPKPRKRKEPAVKP